MDIMKYANEVKELVRASNRLAELGFVTSQGGNLSLRVEDDLVLITPTKVPKADITENDICAVNMKGETLYAAPGRKPTSESPFHLRIFEKRPDIRGVIHAHPPILTGFAIANVDLMQKPFLPEPAIEVGPMVMVPYAMPGSDELARRFDEYVTRSNGFLMQNHGVLMVSDKGPYRAVELLEMTEAAAKSVLVAKILNGLNVLPENDVQDLENVITMRGLPMPGLPGTVQTLKEVFKL